MDFPDTYQLGIAYTSVSLWNSCIYFPNFDFGGKVSWSENNCYHHKIKCKTAKLSAAIKRKINNKFFEYLFTLISKQQMCLTTLSLYQHIPVLGILNDN